MLNWLSRVAHVMVDWLITTIFAIPALWKFLQWAEHGFSWRVIAQLAGIVTAWLGVIVLIVIYQEVKRQREHDEMEIVFFSSHDEKP